MKVITSHPTSNQNNRAAIVGLLNAGILSKFYTCVAVFPKTVWSYLSKFKPFNELKRRQFNSNLKQVTNSYPILELLRLSSSRLNLKTLTKHETGLFSVDAVYRHLDTKVAATIKKASKEDVNAIYAYEDGALNSFTEAKKHGLKCFYDLPIGYWRAARVLLEKEIEIWPEWKATMHGFVDSDAKLKRKDRELELADNIYVASSFTAKTLDYYNGQLAPVKVIPYGFPKPVENRIYNIKNRPIKLLFVGGLSQRKGIANMFAAVEQLKEKVQLTVIGRKPTNDCKALNDALNHHTWIPSVSHAEVLEQMQQHDVLLFPSLFEGFGLVITEAMSQGTPVITTDRTAGPDLITTGKDGWIIEAGSTTALQNTITKLVNNPELIEIAGKAAIDKARSRPWQLYGEELARAMISDN